MGLERPEQAILPRNEGAMSEELPPFRFNEARHVYYLGESPLIGTTTCLGIMDKPGLINWASGMACAEFGWINPKKHSKEEVLAAAKKGLDQIADAFVNDIYGNEYQDWIKFLDKAYKAHNQKKKDTAETGKDLHSLLEDFIRAHMDNNVVFGTFLLEPIIQPFTDWAAKNIKRFLFTEMCCFSRVLHVAGTADFGYEDMEGKFVLGDFKSSESAYYAHYLQCGAYDFQISENGGWTKDGKKIFELTKPFDRYEIFCFRAGLDKPFVTTETNRLKTAFSYCVNLYRSKIWWEEAIDKKESGIKTWKKR